MKVKKGTKLLINHTRKGRFIAIATKNFDTIKDEFYPIVVAPENDEVQGEASAWLPGEKIPCRDEFCTIDVIK